MNAVLSKLKRLVGISPGKRHSRQQKWQHSWSRPGYAPVWRTGEVPAPLLEAVAEGWFTAGQSVLDIGCGSGELSAWLAGQGIRATGIDFAPAAIEQCRQQQAAMTAGPRYAVVDICRPPDATLRYDGLFDRGCFHGIPTDQARDYARSVSSLVDPGGKFLLLHKTIPEGGDGTLAASRQSVRARIAHYFASSFSIESVTETLMAAEQAANNGRSIEGLAFRMVRR